MKIIYSKKHLSYVPRYEIFDGNKDSHSEIPCRIENIKKSLIKEGYKINYLTKTVPLSLIQEVHKKDYINFLKNGSQFTYPSVFPYDDNLNNNKIINKLALIGKYSFDLYTPLMKNILEIASESCSLAYELADDLIKNRIRIGYALCRPPGHHAEKNRMGGYCYLNNTAIAAQYLSKRGKVAILDVDFHHGNGTQGIFYDREDILTISIHADPNWKFPYFSGFANEIGVGNGIGRNFNYPLPKGTTNNQYQKTLENALKKIEDFKPKNLVIPLGSDTHKDDPIGGFSLTTDYYTVMAKTINTLKLPTIIIQEGGYNTNLLGTNVAAFLNGFI